MAFTKITAQDRADKGVSGLPDSPNMTTSALQNRFDSLGNLGIDGLNRLIDELAAESAANNVGASVPSSLVANPNVQSVINSISSAINTLNAASHTHTNKAVLDNITASLVSSWNALVTLLASITTVQSTLTDNTAAIPNSHAVKTYVDSNDIKTRAVNAVYPIGTVYQCVSTANPGSVFGGTWTQIGYDNPIFIWRRDA